jgi:pimeloyl-ACP methyl ester carboxylesterase
MVARACHAGLTVERPGGQHPGMDRLRVGEVELCYDLMGDLAQPVLVLVAGLGSSLATWDERFVKLLCDAGFAVLRFDNRDSGQSTMLDGAPRFDLKAAARRDRSVVTYTLDDLADDTAGLVDVLGVAPVHLVGVSLGGMIGQMTAARHPDRVRTLCSIMSTTGARDVGLPRADAGEVLIKPPGKDRASFVEGELENERLIGSTRPDLVDEAWRRAKAERMWDHGVHPRGTGRLLMAIMASGDRTEALRTITAPTLVVHGDADGLIDVSGGWATAEAISGAELLVIPGLGHELPPAVWPQLVAAVVANTRRREPVR